MATKRKRPSVIHPQKAVTQKAVRGGKITTAKGKRVTATQKRVAQKAAPKLIHLGSEGGWTYYKTRVPKRQR